MAKEKRNKYPNWRIYFLIIVFGIAFFSIIIRLFIIQVKDSSNYKEIAKRQYESKLTLYPQRGSIFDRNMNTLVSSTMYYSFGCDPYEVQDEDFVTNTFANYFKKSKTYYKEKLDKDKRFVWLERRVPENIAKEIDNLKLKGLIKIEEPKRVYLFNEVCGHVLGCTNIDNIGLSGLELQFEQKLHGTDGYIILQRDGKGKLKPSIDLPRFDPANGNDVVLTLDLVYQTIVDEELAKGAAEFEAEGAMAVMIDPSTGAILALSNYPQIDPNNVSSARPEQARNRAITDMFEPGSTFKLVTVASALEEGVITPQDKYYCENGKYKTSSGAVVEDVHKFGLISLEEAVQNSSNIFMTKLVKFIGDEKFYKYSRNFGFGINTGIELPGEMKGEMKKPVEWSNETLTYLSFGYQLSSTVLQITSAYSAIANKGVLMKVHIIDKIIDNNDQVIYQSEPQIIRRVVSEKTASEMTRMLEMVVQNGTGKSANIEGVKIAGKTGTAQKIIEGKYSKKNYCASFVGYAPSQNPKFVLMILMDTPKKSFYGGEVSAPIFKRIVSRIMNFENLKEKPIQENDQVIAKIPDVSKEKFETAKNLLETSGFKVEKIGKGNKIIKQYPPANHRIANGEIVKLFTVSDSLETINSIGQMPVVIGLSIREAIKTLSANYLDISVLGTGIVKSQDPAPGVKIKNRMKCKLVCETSFN